MQQDSDQPRSDATQSRQEAEPADSASPGNPFWIGAQRDLERAAEQWRRCDWLGVDTEFVRERTYHARLGLVQASDGERVWLLDPLAVESLAPLGEMLEAEDTVKVFHAAREDIEVLHRYTGCKPWPLFDTQRAAALAGFPLQCAYATLVAALLDVHIPKGTARTNWLARPLSAEQLEYAAADVRYLPRMAHALVARLDTGGRRQWLQEDLELLLRQALSVPDPQSQYRRVRGAADLRDKPLARLHTLSAWRERQARKHDLPKSFVLRDEDLVSLAVQGAEDAAAVRAVLSPRSRAYKHSAEQLPQMLAAPGPAPEPVPGRLEAAERRRVKQMQQKVRACAERLGVEPALLASRRDLERLVRQPPDTGDDNILSGWRGQLLRPELEPVLTEGEAS